jgi:hypothetical protein
MLFYYLLKKLIFLRSPYINYMCKILIENVLINSNTIYCCCWQQYLLSVV